MKRILFTCLLIFTFSCSSSDEDIATETIPTEFNFEYNIHSSLPADWTTEFYKIMKDLLNVIFQLMQIPIRKFFQCFVSV